jgi:hypothetical protein
MSMGYRDTCSENPNSSESDPLGLSDDAVGIRHGGLVRLNALTIWELVDRLTKLEHVIADTITDVQGDDYCHIRKGMI